MNITPEIISIALNEINMYPSTEEINKNMEYIKSNVQKIINYYPEKNITQAIQYLVLAE